MINLRNYKAAIINLFKSLKENIIKRRYMEVYETIMKILKLEYVVSKVKIYCLDLTTD